MSAIAFRRVGARPLIIGSGLLLVAGAYLLGRSSGRPGPTAPAVESPAGGKEAAEAGVVKFEEASLQLAGIGVEPIGYRSLPSHLPVTGTVEPNLSGVVNVTARVGGKITQCSATVGTNVQAGQCLATLASTELAAAQAAWQQAEQRVTLARTNLERQKQLAGLGEFSGHKIEEARDRAFAGQGEADRLRSELAAARNEVIEARSDLSARKGEVASQEAEVASGNSEIAEAEGQVRAAEAGLLQAQSQVKVAQSTFNRTDRLLNAGIASRQQWELDRSGLERAQAEIDTARAGIAQAQAKVETAKAHQQAAREQVRAAQGRVEEAEAKIETAKSRQAQVEASLASALKRAEVTGQSLAREERIFKGGYLTSKEVVEAEAALRQAELEREAAANNIRVVGGTPGGGNVLSIRAPIAGRIVERPVTLGETVTSEKTLFVLANLNTVWIQLNVYQKDLSLVRVGQAVTITSDTAPGRTFSGVVSYIGDAVDETTRAVKLRAVIQNIGGTLKPQTFVRGKIATAVRARVLAVPNDAVQDLDGKVVVFVAGAHPGEFLKKEVQKGDTIDGQTIVAGGLQPGARVVVRGAFMVKAQAMKAELAED